jgi:hypothetical protein
MLFAALPKTKPLKVFIQTQSAMNIRRRIIDSRHNPSQQGSGTTDMHRNFSMSGSGTRGSELGGARIGAEDDDIRRDVDLPDEGEGVQPGTINDLANQRDTPWSEEASRL